MGGIANGILLGMANAGVITLGLVLPEGQRWFALGTVIFMIALVPSVLAGAVLGWIAEVLAESHLWIRLAWLIVPAIAVVAWLGVVFEMRGYIAVSSVPTVAACLLLERSTRRRPTPPLPVAAVRR